MIKIDERKTQRNFKYADRENSYITVRKVNEPYGEGTETVISVGSTLKGDFENPTWKVHIPLHLAVSVANEIQRLAGLADMQLLSKKRVDMPSGYVHKRKKTNK